MLEHFSLDGTAILIGSCSLLVAVLPLLTVSMADVARPEIDESEEELTDVDEHEKRADAHLLCRINRSIDGVNVRGAVMDIERGKTSKAKLYRILYEDHDEEHFTYEELEKFKLPDRVFTIEVERVLSSNVLHVWITSITGESRNHICISPNRRQRRLREWIEVLASDMSFYLGDVNVVLVLSNGTLLTRGTDTSRLSDVFSDVRTTESWPSDDPWDDSRDYWFLNALRSNAICW